MTYVSLFSILVSKFKSVVEIKVGHRACPTRNPFCPMLQLRYEDVQFWLENINTKSTTRPFKSPQPKQFKETLQIHTIIRCLYESKLCYITFKVLLNNCENRFMVM